MAQLENIEVIEKRLWKSADTLRANSELASNEYFLPVMGLIFLRHAYSRYLAVKDEIVANLPSRGGKTRELTKEDFSKKSAIYLKPEAQFDYLIALTDADNRAEAIIHAMDSIEADYTNLRNQLPKQEYNNIPNDVLGMLLRTLNPEELKKATGDIFGRIYEYFLTQFADQGAHDGGEFFTPVSLVQLIVNVLEPDHGKIFDPACGSGGMFVQSAHFMERHAQDPHELTFYGHEKNRVTTRLAKMNLAVHGLEGNVEGGEAAITYYNDPHEGLFGTVDYVMANPPFNVDEVDADKIKGDKRRLPFGLPGVNKNKKVSNANYLWIQYFYSYLNDTGRAGFVMSSQASSAGRDEAKVREQLVKTGHVDIMVDIRGNFFYTRTVPCQLWFLNKNKPAHLKDKVLMLDARNVYRKVTRKIYDFSPEQQQNLTAVVWLYRGEGERFVELVKHYIDKSIFEAHNCEKQGEKSEELACEPIPDFITQLGKFGQAFQPFMDKLEQGGVSVEPYVDFLNAKGSVEGGWSAFQILTNDLQKWWNEYDYNDAASLLDFIDKDTCLKDLAEQSRKLIKEIDLAYKLATRVIELAEANGAKDSELWDNTLLNGRGRSNLKKTADEARKLAVEQLKQVRYFYKQAHWLLSRFPEGKLCDVEGLVKLVDIKDIEAADWSLTPGRYVGVAPEEVDEDFDFEEALRDIHIELQGLNAEAAELAEKIARNFEELGV
ncbi:N-6 DNA methylase [Proteus terrae]|uniref:class I SAM-dependent DNA methyltransferase n=1 Tax=Proteus terrae TaxID=1574161 RepID=UPI0018C545F3|nr:N-6 DNA methylase [Proteus terrae]MBG2837626.1 N-6 DNA methylase [Proteus terrae subsp. cibarius]MBG2867997.1 N-6 DNA methylase [Proteus terrae subsp. cibarius]